MYQKIVENGYIVSVVKGISSGNITEEEYSTIMEVIRNRPVPPDGYGYVLKDSDLTWEMYELPVVPPEDEEATEDDYKYALNTLGVSTDEEI